MRTAFRRATRLAGLDKDSLAQTLPAIFYLVLNAYLAVAGFR